MKYCPTCGYKITDINLKYCPECGSLLDKGSDNTNPKTYNSKGLNLVMDYYEKGVESPYYELALYAYNTKELLLEEYRNGGSESETCTQKLVPFEAYKKAMEIVRKYHLKGLMIRKGPGLDGMKYVIKFRDTFNAQDMYRFSSENVGEKDTIMMFYDMKNLLSSYLMQFVFL